MKLCPRQAKARYMNGCSDAQTLNHNSGCYVRFTAHGLDKNLKSRCLFMPSPFEEWWRGIKCYPCPSFCPLSKFGVRSITFERLHRFNLNGMLIYNIKTQVKFDLGYNPRGHPCPMDTFLVLSRVGLP